MTKLALVWSALAGLAMAAEAPHKQKVSYTVPRAAPIAPVPAATVIHLAIGIPPRDPTGLAGFAAAVSDPKDKQYGHFLTPEELTARFGPSEADYQKVIDWARANELTVEGKYSHRLLLGVSGAAADVERALAVKLSYARRPDGTQFYRPDRAPSLDLDVKVTHVAGVDNLFVPKVHGGTQGGLYASIDVRNAYAAGCLGLTGANETVGIMAYSGYLHSDVAGYQMAAGLPSTGACGLSTPTSPPCLVDVSVNGFAGTVIHTPTDYAAEATADVELAIAMAPQLHQVKVFEADPTAAGCTSGDAVIAAMAMASDTKQFSSSVSFCVSDNINLLNMMAGAGQSFFAPSGDFGGGYNASNLPVFNYWLQAKVIGVGGTELVMNGNGFIYNSEQAWKFSGGGVENLPTVPSTCPAGCTPGAAGCSNNCIPAWQHDIANASNGASSTYRNDPDLAMPSDNLFIFYSGPSGHANTFCGTSASAPLMAGFMALVNQQKCITFPAACAHGQGFASPVIYDVGRNAATYTSSFHDVVGNSPVVSPCSSGFTGQSLNAVAGYDLATGWGTPTCGLVAQLDCTTCSGAVPSPAVPPSTTCVNFEMDSNNCGSCGHVCPAAMPCASGTCGGPYTIGDTHIATLDGLFYDFQASGDFLLITTSPAFVVQTRQIPWSANPNVTVNQAVAMRLGQARVALFVPGNLVVDGKPVQLADGKSLSAVDGVEVSRSGDTYLVRRSATSETVAATMHASWMDVVVGLGYSPAGAARGLLGDGDGKTDDDMRLRDGTVLTQPLSFEDLYHRYADNLRVSREESLFGDEGGGKPGAPAGPFYANDLAAAQYEAARATCQNAGVANQALLDACTLDVAVLGDPKASAIYVGAPPPVAVMQPGAHPRKPPGCGSCAAAPNQGNGGADLLSLLLLALVIILKRRPAHVSFKSTAATRS